MCLDPTPQVYEDNIKLTGGKSKKGITFETITPFNQ
jgi:hypothetical protein